jgi:hypothetical protein
VLPDFLHVLCENGALRIGPIPAGTPVNLLANINPDAPPAELVKLCLKLKKTLLEVNVRKMDDDATREYMKKELLQDLLDASKCPDLIEDRGHLYGSDLSEADKKALIEFLKTF